MIISLKPHIIIRRPYKSVAGNGLVADGGRRQTERKKTRHGGKIEVPTGFYLRKKAYLCNRTLSSTGCTKNL